MHACHTPKGFVIDAEACFEVGKASVAVAVVVRVALLIIH